MLHCHFFLHQTLLIQIHFRRRIFWGAKAIKKTLEQGLEQLDRNEARAGAASIKTELGWEKSLSGSPDSNL